MLNTLQTILDQKIVAIIRGATPGREIIPIIKALRDGGIKVVEISATTPSFLSLVQQVSEVYNDVTVGAGTVLDPETAQAAIKSGAKFILSPSVNVDTIRLTKRYGVVSIPGALTPTEIVTAYENGADIVKVFPAGTVGPGYLRDIHGPLSQVPLMPTGGINLSNVADYIKNGAVAVGIGSELINVEQQTEISTLKRIKERALKFVEKVGQNSLI